MATQDPLFPERDVAARREGERRRDEAMGRVSDHAPDAFKSVALSAIYYVASRRRELTTDPVETVLLDKGVPPPPDMRVMGPLMRQAAALGWIRKTGRTHKSVMPDCHRRDKAVYESLIYGGV